ncbi:hypothetical protein B0H13DRAFT_1908188 [Mycena leptocephala]|nr:hypothetical protein B0H13DRAFT_1908188 [Mycena leptocephala]
MIIGWGVGSRIPTNSQIWSANVWTKVPTNGFSPKCVSQNPENGDPMVKVFAQVPTSDQGPKHTICQPNAVSSLVELYSFNDSNFGTLLKAVWSLNTVRRKGMGKIYILELAEEILA